MRFNAKGPARPGGEAHQLRDALASAGVELHIIDVEVGTSITETVFTTMEGCDAFIAFGTSDYGQATGNPAATDQEVAYWKNTIQKADKQRPLVLLRMIPFEAAFEHLTARVLFGTNALALTWLLGAPMPPGTVETIMKALDFEHATPGSPLASVLL